MNQTRIQGSIKAIGNYVLESELGAGQFGKVFKAKDKTTGTYYAVKRIDKRKINSNPLLPKLLSTEIKIMQEIEHPNVLHLFDYIESATHYYLVLTFCNQGDLEHYMKTRGLKYFEEDEAIGLLQQVFNGFHELRKKKVLHRDFKLANIFMNDDVLVIGDFGLAKQGFDTGSTFLGTPQTMAPELLFQDFDTTLIYDSKADIWSIGVVYYQLLFGDAPYSGVDQIALKRSMRERTGKNLVFPREVSEHSKDILRRMLTVKTDDRINWTEMFNHPLFKKKTQIKPSVLSGMNKMLKSMAGQADRLPADPQAQFVLNRQHAQSIDTVQLLTPGNLGTPLPVPTKHFEEKPVDPSLENQILQEMALQEITYTYNHERNKILFLVFTVKHLQWALTNPKFSLYAEPLFNLSILILKKARVLNEGLIRNLADGNNIFQINPHFWSLYVGSSKLAETRALFVGLSSLLQEYYELVNFRISENGFSLKAFDRFLAGPYADLAQMDQVMLDEKAKLAVLKATDVELLNDPSLASKLACLERLVDVSIRSEQSLRYLENLNGVQRKFQMESFYKSITQNQGVPFY